MHKRRCWSALVTLEHTLRHHTFDDSAMTSAVKHSACVSLAIDAFDSIVYSQATAFVSLPVRVANVKRSEA